MIRAVLFDMDGVLTDAGPWHFEALNLALTSYGYTPIGLEEHREFFDGLPTRIKLTRLVERRSVNEKDVEGIAAIKQAKTLKLIEANCQFDPDKFCLFAGLKRRGYGIGIVSNAKYETVQLVAAYMGLVDMIDIYTTNEDGYPKPDPFIYELAANRFHCSPWECLAIEDNEYGVKSATDAKCQVLRVKNPSELTAKAVWDVLQKE